MSKRVNNKKGRGKGGQGKHNAQWWNESWAHHWNLRRRGRYAQANALEEELEGMR